MTQLVWTACSSGRFYALVALGYSMVYGIIKLLNFAHGDLYCSARSAASPSCPRWAGSPRR
ncbi:hypothetical protein [Nonomuraea dietziae]|uniref:hypothetical protein n=1 Tax=Nonomuraea dietziae TaxID=65515 RepID=UPI0031CF42CA